MPSIVVTFLLATADSGVRHERTAWPSRCTVQAPQSAMPQPNFVPVSPISSRRTHRRGVPAGTSRSYRLPLMVTGVIAILLSAWELQRFQGRVAYLKNHLLHADLTSPASTLPLRVSRWGRESASRGPVRGGIRRLARMSCVEARSWGLGSCADASRQELRVGRLDGLGRRGPGEPEPDVTSGREA